MIESQGQAPLKQKQNLSVSQASQKQGDLILNMNNNTKYAQLYSVEKQGNAEHKLNLSKKLGFCSTMLNNIHEDIVDSQIEKTRRIYKINCIWSIQKSMHKIILRNLSSHFYKLLMLNTDYIDLEVIRKEQLIINDQRNETKMIKRVLSKISQEQDQQTKQQVQVINSTNQLKVLHKESEMYYCNKKVNKIQIQVLGCRKKSSTFWMDSSRSIQVPHNQSPLSPHCYTFSPQNTPKKLINLSANLNQQELEQEKSYSICQSSRSYTLFYKNQILKQLQKINKNKSLLAQVQVVKEIRPSLASTASPDNDDDNSSQIGRFIELSQSQCMEYQTERTFTPRASWNQNSQNLKNMFRKKFDPSCTVKEVNKNKLKGKKKIQIRPIS